MLPRIIYQSAYDKKGKITHIWDGYNLNSFNTALSVSSPIVLSSDASHENKTRLMNGKIANLLLNQRKESTQLVDKYEAADINDINKIVDSKAKETKQLDEETKQLDKETNMQVKVEIKDELKVDAKETTEAKEAKEAKEADKEEEEEEEEAKLIFNSMNVSEGDQLSIVYEGTSTANEISLGYFILPDDGKQIKGVDEIKTIIMLFPCATQLAHGSLFPIIGSDYLTNPYLHPFDKNQEITCITEIKESYNFKQDAKLGFVIFVRCWDKDRGFVPRLDRAIWSEACLNSDLGKKVLIGGTEINYQGQHFLGYKRAKVPIKNAPLGFSAEDTPAHWYSDLDFADLLFYVLKLPDNFSGSSASLNLPPLNLEPSVPVTSPYCGDLKIHNEKLLAVVGLPESDNYTGAVALLNLNTNKLPSLKMQALPTEIKERNKSKWILLRPPTKNRAGPGGAGPSGADSGGAGGAGGAGPTNLLGKSKNLKESTPANGDWSHKHAMLYGASLDLGPNCIAVAAPLARSFLFDKAGVVYLYNSIDSQTQPLFTFSGQWTGARLGTSICFNREATLLACSVDRGPNGDCVHIFKKGPLGVWAPIPSHILRRPTGFGTDYGNNSLTFSKDGRVIVVANSQLNVLWFYNYQVSTGVWSKPFLISLLPSLLDKGKSFFNYTKEESIHIGSAISIDENATNLAISAYSDKTSGVVLLKRREIFSYDTEKITFLNFNPTSKETKETKETKEINYLNNITLHLSPNAKTLYAQNALLEKNMLASKLYIWSSLSTASETSVITSASLSPSLHTVDNTNGWTLVQSLPTSGYEPFGDARSPKFDVGSMGVAIRGPVTHSSLLLF